MFTPAKRKTPGLSVPPIAAAFFVVAAAVIVMPAAQAAVANEEECRVLVAFRDGPLASKWQDAVKGIDEFDSLLARLKETHSLLDRQRHSEATWGALLTTVEHVKLLADQIQSWGAVVNPEVGTIKAVAGGIRDFVRYELWRAKDAAEIWTGLIKAIVQNASVYSATILAVHEQVDEMMKIGKDAEWMADVEQLSAKLTALEQKMNAAASQLKGLRSKLPSLNAIKQQIDSECGGTDADKLLAAAQNSAAALVSGAGNAVGQAGANAPTSPAGEALSWGARVPAQSYRSSAVKPYLCKDHLDNPHCAYARPQPPHVQTCVTTTVECETQSCLAVHGRAPYQETTCN